MRATRRWVRLTRADIPITPKGRAATVPDAWSSFTTATRSSIGGIGFVVSSGVVFLLVRGEAARAPAEFPVTYAEAVPSGVRIRGSSSAVTSPISYVSAPPVFVAWTTSSAEALPTVSTSGSIGPPSVFCMGAPNTETTGRDLLSVLTEQA
jgi:hypothetical protein